MNWTPGFDRTFREHRGYDVIPWLSVLAGHVVDSRENLNAFLADFRKSSRWTMGNGKPRQGGQGKPQSRHRPRRLGHERARTVPQDDRAGKPLALDLGIVWRPPFRVNLGKSVKAGENTLEVMVVNSWYNRLIGDASLPEDQRLTKTNIQVTVNGPGKWQLEPSGLLGSVILVGPKP